MEHFKNFLNIESETKKIDRCPEHGDFESKLFFKNHWSKCPVCMDIATKKMAEEESKIRIEEEKKQKARLVERRLGASELPKRFISSFLDNYIAETREQKKALKTCLNYVDAFPQNFASGTCLIFCGTVGTGKTHLAVGIAKEIAKMGYQPLFCTVAKAIRSVKETYNYERTETERQAIDMFIKPDLLILDEVGVQFGSETEKNIIFEIINGRYEDVKPTIIISNLAKDKLQDFFGERAFDRLRQGGGKLVVTDWASYRYSV